MKKNGICLFIILILAVSCARSRFATTTRQYHNGKVVYTNHYTKERLHLKRQKTKHPASHTRETSAIIAGKPVDNPDKINKMDLIASSDKNIPILNNKEKQISRYTNNPYPEFQNEKESSQPKHSLNTLIKNLSAGIFKEIFHGDTTLVNKKDNSKENASGTVKTDNPKTEKLGLIGFILSFLGMIPVFGFPFAVLAIVFGSISLSKIKRYPKKYKGKGLATASIVLGCIMLVINIIIIVNRVNTEIHATTSALSSMRC